VLAGIIVGMKRHGGGRERPGGRACQRESPRPLSGLRGGFSVHAAVGEVLVLRAALCQTYCRRACCCPTGPGATVLLN